MKTFCVRFDIDTPTCLQEGVPRLLDLGERLNFPATYFLSVGRAISRSGAIARMLAPAGARAERAAALSARKKLGNAGYAKLALLNPPIGLRGADIVARINRLGEVGLHGGRNHDTWQNHSREWPRSRVESEVDWALAWLRAQQIDVKGFCSPGWTQPPELAAILKARGLLYRADVYGTGLPAGVEELPGFFNLSTNLVGIPGGVAYLEHKRALGLNNAQIRDAFRSELRASGDHAVMYDHPYYAGVHALDSMEDIVTIAQEEGFTLVTMAYIAERLAS